MYSGSCLELRSPCREGRNWLLYPTLVCAWNTVCLDLFALPLGGIGRLMFCDCGSSWTSSSILMLIMWKIMCARLNRLRCSVTAGFFLSRLLTFNVYDNTMYFSSLLMVIMGLFVFVSSVSYYKL